MTICLPWGVPAIQFPVLLEQIKALADETRLKIFKLVADQEFCVCQIVPAVGLSQPTVSIHLGKLKRARLVRERRAGQWSFYSGDPEGIAAFREALAEFFAADPASLPELREVVARVGPTKSEGGRCDGY